MNIRPQEFTFGKQALGPFVTRSLSPEQILTVRQASEYLDLSVQSIYLIMKAKRLKSTRNAKGRHSITVADLDAYIASKHVREKGEFLKWNKEGYFRPPQIAKILNCSAAQIYHRMRNGTLPCQYIAKYGYIIHLKDFSKEGLFNKVKER